MFSMHTASCVGSSVTSSIYNAIIITGNTVPLNYGLCIFYFQHLTYAVSPLAFYGVVINVGFRWVLKASLHTKKLIRSSCSSKGEGTICPLESSGLPSVFTACVDDFCILYDYSVFQLVINTYIIYNTNKFKILLISHKGFIR